MKNRQTLNHSKNRSATGRWFKILLTVVGSCFAIVSAEATQIKVLNLGSVNIEVTIDAQRKNLEISDTGSSVEENFNMNMAYANEKEVGFEGATVKKRDELSGGFEKSMKEEEHSKKTWNWSEFIKTSDGYAIIKPGQEETFSVPDDAEEYFFSLKRGDKISLINVPKSTSQKMLPITDEGYRRPSDLPLTTTDAYFLRLGDDIVISNPQNDKRFGHAVAKYGKSGVPLQFQLAVKRDDDPKTPVDESTTIFENDKVYIKLADESDAAPGYEGATYLWMGIGSDPNVYLAKSDDIYYKERAKWSIQRVRPKKNMPVGKDNRITEGTRFFLTSSADPARKLSTWEDDWVKGHTESDFKAYEVLLEGSWSVEQVGKF